MCFLKKFNFYLPVALAKQVDNRFGSIHSFVCLHALSCLTITNPRFCPCAGNQGAFADNLPNMGIQLLIHGLSFCSQYFMDPYVKLCFCKLGRWGYHRVKVQKNRPNTLPFEPGNLLSCPPQKSMLVHRRSQVHFANFYRPRSLAKLSSVCSPVSALTLSVCNQLAFADNRTDAVDQLLILDFNQVVFPAPPPVYGYPFKPTYLFSFK